MAIQPQDITNFLMERFRPDLAQGLSVCVKFVWGQGEGERCQIAIHNELAQAPADETADLTLLFASGSILRAIVLGQKNPIDAFLTGEFRSDGGLPLVSPVLTAFGGR